jgi:hypothetical protein
MLTGERVILRPVTVDDLPRLLRRARHFGAAGGPPCQLPTRIVLAGVVQRLDAAERLR